MTVNCLQAGGSTWANVGRLQFPPVEMQELTAEISGTELTSNLLPTLTDPKSLKSRRCSRIVYITNRWCSGWVTASDLRSSRGFYSQPQHCWEQPRARGSHVPSASEVNYDHMALWKFE